MIKKEFFPFQVVFFFFPPYHHSSVNQQSCTKEPNQCNLAQIRVDALTRKDGKERKLGKFEESFEKECFGLAAYKGRRN